MEAHEAPRIAFYEKARKGILIHAALLDGSPFQPGDRFSVHPRPTELFSVTLVRDENGEIFCDRHGIFLARTRRIDILMGGIFDRYLVTFGPEGAGRIRLRPLAVVQDQSQEWF